MTVGLTRWTPAKLREELAARGLSQGKLARLTGVDARTVRRWVDARGEKEGRPLALGVCAMLELAWRRIELEGQGAGEEGAGEGAHHAAP